MENKKSANAQSHTLLARSRASQKKWPESTKCYDSTARRSSQSIAVITMADQVYFVRQEMGFSTGHNLLLREEGHNKHAIHTVPIGKETTQMEARGRTSR